MRKKFDEAGVDPSSLRSLKDLEKIPVTTRDEFIASERANPPFGGFLAVPHQTLRRIYIHPGPQYETLSDADVEHVSRLMPKLGARKGDVVMNSLSYQLVPAGLLLDEALGLNGVTVVPMGGGNTDLQVQVMHDLKATGFIGFPSFLMTVVRRAEELGYNFRRDFSLRFGLIVGSYELRKSFQQDYGIDTTELYGFLPVGVPGCECELKSGMHIEEDFIVEIADPATGKQLAPGQVGEVVVTTIFNEVLPRIRVGSGDLGYYSDEPCPCGRTSHRLMQIVGRVGEGVKLRGMFIHPREISDVIKNFPAISRFQIAVTRAGLKDVILAKFELRDDSVDKEWLVSGFQKDFQSRCRLRVDKVEFLVPGTMHGDTVPVVDLRKEIVL